MQRGIAVLCACAALFGGAGAAAAHNSSTPTAVTIAGTHVSPPGTLAVFGYVQTSSGCRSDRVVNVYSRYGEWTPRHVWGPGDWELADVSRTSAHGFYAGAMPEPGLWSTKVRVMPRTTGRRGHRHVCQGDTVGLTF